MCFYCHLNLVLQLILCFFLVAFSFTMVVDNVSFLLVHLINTHLSSYFYTTQMNWQEKWTHLPVRKLENHHGFGRTQVTVFDSNNLPLCFWQETLKCCSPVLVLLYCYTLCGTEHAGCWGVERAQSQVSLLLVAISVSLDKGPVSLPSCQESEISQSPASRLIGICIYYWFTLARWCVLKAQGMLSYV